VSKRSGDRVGRFAWRVLSIGPQLAYIIPMGEPKFRAFNNGRARGTHPHGDASASFASVKPNRAGTSGEHHAPAQPSSTSRWRQL
jgi:hypothetical protein